ncbi:uncharacterized protein LOC113676378 [Paramuricea clavata]|uniref:Uncharacterized protein LOC113676378 n=1 Tax=Paramuricea clavata TaxID=317549 RepID=A0A6S7GRK6_PARCT|nr:uncharacterized protein LOC113676378 [Paramuricea clavata]
MTTLPSPISFADVNECEDSDCQQECINYPGGYNCSCFNGYRTNATDYKRCDDTDECSEKRAGCSQICTNTRGGFNCSCNSGYHLGWDKRFCTDIDECKSSQHGCQSHMCVNILGSYKCRCRPGFKSSRDGKNCIGKPCLPIYRPVNGNKTCSGYTTEHTCVFSCSVGYKQVGSHNRTCSASKRWTGKEAKCEPIHCPAPPEPANGFVYSPCNTRFNSECLAGCNKGYYINGTAKLTCTVNGTWKSRKISCNEIRVCEPNPCRHGGECTTITSRQFSCDCSSTGYQGTTCETGVINIPDYPTLIAGIPTKSIEFRASPPDISVTFTPRGLGRVEFNPPYLVFQRNVTMSQSLTITAQQPGLFHVDYYLSGPSAASFRKPERNTFFVESAENAAPNITYDNEDFSFASGCYKLQLNKCPRSNETITAYSTSPWFMFGPTAITEDQVSLSTGNVELLHSMGGITFWPEKRSSLSHDCAVDSLLTYSTVELVKNRALTKSFLKVLRNNLPKWLDIKLRENIPSNSMVYQARYLTGKSLREEAAFEGQPLTEDTFFSSLVSPDLDLFVHGNRVPFGLQDRRALVSVALELCGPPPSNVILRPLSGTVDVMNKISVMKQLRDRGWNFKIDSLQISRGSFWKRSLTMFATFSKDLEISDVVKSRVNFEGTIIVNVDNLNNIMDVPLDQTWLVELNGNAVLTLEFKVQSKMTKLAIKMPRTQSYATFGGGSQEDCSREMNSNPHGLHLTSVLEENPFVRTELNEFVELDQTRNMSCFLSTIFYTDKRSNGSNYRETSDGVIMTFRGHLKFGTLRFDNLDVKLWMENIRCPNTAIRRRSGIVAKLSGYYGRKKNKGRKLGIFEIPSDSVINLHIGQNLKAASRGFFPGMVNVFGFQSKVNVTISHNGLEFYVKGKIHGLFDASAIFKSGLISWKKQRYTATGGFESKAAADNLYRVLENEFTKYSTEFLKKIHARLERSTQTEERAKSRLREVQILRDEWLKNVKEMIGEYEKVEDQLGLAEKNLERLLDLVRHYSNKIRVLNQELDKLCKVVCRKICQRGKNCTTCLEDVIVKEMGKCSATCHQAKQERIPPLIIDATCKNEHCKRIHAVHSWLGDYLGLVVGVGGMFLELPPQVSFGIGKSVSQFTRSIKKGDLDYGTLLDGVTQALPVVGASKPVAGLVQAVASVAKGNRNPLSIVKSVVGQAVPVIDGVLSLVDRSQGRWKCKVKEEKCTKESFEYNYIHDPYKCELPCEKRSVADTIPKKCCSIVSCASFIVNASCISEKTICKKARKDALKKISKFNAAIVLLNLDSAQQNVSVWKMKRERMSVKVRSASNSLKAYQDAVDSLEKAYKVTVENRKRKLEILAKPMMLKNLLNKLGGSLIKIENIKFKGKVSAEHNTTLLLVRITVTLNGTQYEEISTVLDFTNLNRSLRSIAKEILGVYVGDASRFSRKKRSTKNTNASTDELKFYTLQTFHRLCSEFSNHKRILYDVAMSLYNFSSEIQQLREYEKRRETFLIVNNSAIFEKVNFNQRKAIEFGVEINYDSYSDVLENDPELLEAKAFQKEVLKNEVEAVHLSSKLFYKNWLATMESIFGTISEECSGFDDCLKYTIDSLSEISFDTGILNAEKLRAQIDDIKIKFFNLTRKSDMSVKDAMKISWNILQMLEDMTDEENVCAQAPSIAEYRAPLTELGVNETLVLRCNATGDSLVYQWRFNGKILKHESTNVLRINHSGNYSCDVWNHVAKASSIIAVVVVGTPPVIVRHPDRRHNVVLSGYDSLLCQVKKDERNISYQWWFKPMKFNSFKALPNETFSRLSFSPVRTYHEGWYFCNVSNRFGHTSSKTSYVKVLNFSLPLPVAKLSLTVISKLRSSNISVFYQETLAKVLAFRFSTTNNSSRPSEERIKELHPTGCRIITLHNGTSSRTEICDWTFSAVGENVTSNAVLNSSPSHQIKRMIEATLKLKSLISQLGNETNADGITFTLGKTNYSVEENSLNIMAMSLLCPKRQFLVENVDYKCVDCPPGSYGTLKNGVATCNICPRDFYQSNPGQIYCIKCPKGFITTGQGAYDHKQCKDENKFFAVFVLVNNYHGDVLVTTNVSGQLEIDHLKPTKKVVKSKKWKTKKWLSVSAVDATTNRTVDINEHSVIHLEPTIKNLIWLNVLYIQAPKLVDPNMKTASTLTTLQTNTFTTPPDIHSTDGAPRKIPAEKVVSTETVPGRPLTAEFAEDFKGSSKVTEENGQHDENRFFAMFVLVNNYQGDVLVTTNVSGELEIDHLKLTKKVVKSKQWKTKKWLSVSAVDATTNRTVDINGHSVIHLEPTIKNLISLNVLYIQAPKLVDANMKTASTLTALQTNTFTTPPDIHSTDGAPRKFPAEKVVPTETVPGRPLTAEFAEDFKDSANVTERNGQHG